MAKAPAFQFYPDKWLAGTKHLSDRAGRAYIDLLCWMWLHGKGHCRMPNTDHGWSVATGLAGEALEAVRAEIMHAEFPLLKVRRANCVSDGLRKEAKKQRDRQEQMKNAAKARWGKGKRGNRPQCDSNAYASTTQCSSSPSSSPTPSNNKHTEEEGAREEVDGFEIGGVGAPPKVQTTPAQVMAFQGVYRQAIYPENPAHAPSLKDSWLDAVTNKWTPEFTASITPEMLKAAKGKTDDRYWSPNTFLTWFEGPGKNWKGGKRPIPPQKPPDPEIARMEAFLGLPVPEQERHIAEAKKQYPGMPRNVLRAEAARRLAKENDDKC